MPNITVKSIIEKFANKFGYSYKEAKDVLYYVHGQVKDAWEAKEPVSLVYPNVFSLRTDNNRIYKVMSKETLSEKYRSYLKEYYKKAEEKKKWRVSARARNTSLWTRLEKKLKKSGE